METVVLLLSGESEVLTNETKVPGLNPFFDSVFTKKTNCDLMTTKININKEKEDL